MIEPGAIFQATDETKLSHSTPQGYRVIVLSSEGVVLEGSKLWDCLIVREHKTGMVCGHKLTEEEINRFLYVGNLYEMLGKLEVVYG